MAGPPGGTKQPAAATSHPRTRASQSHEADTLPNKEDLAKTNRIYIPSPKQAKEILQRNSYIPNDEPVTLPLLSYALLLLLQAATPKIMNDGIKAVARILESEAVEKDSDSITSYVKDKLSPFLERAEQAMESMTNSTDEVRKVADRLYRTGEDTRDEVYKSVDSLNSAIKNIEPQSARPNLQDPSPMISYAAAASAQLPISHSNTLARSRARERQILVDKDPSATADSLADLSEIELVAKANAAIDRIRSEREGEEEGEGALAIGAKKLRNGGVVFEINTRQAAQWIRREKIAFEGNFGGTSIVKDRSVSVIIENVPIGFSPDALAENKKIERDSGLDPDSVVSTRWIKPPHRRLPSQRTAHIIARFRSPDAANRAIRDGVIIAGKRSWARRMAREPRRCLKCHDLDSRHFAAECDKQDVCGTCGKDHRTAVCSETDHDKFRCANCKVSGHASWDRACPRFVEKCKRMENSDPESSYKYFPSEEAWTWEQRASNKDGPAPPSRSSDDLPQVQDPWSNQVRASDWFDETERSRPWSRNSRHNREPQPNSRAQPQSPSGVGRSLSQMRQATISETTRGLGAGGSGQGRHEYIA